MTIPATLPKAAVAEIYRRPLMALVFEAATVHRQYHDGDTLQCSTLLSIKTGACAEDCTYCSQSAHNDTELESEPLLDTAKVIAGARAAVAQGADRFCMGVAWPRIRNGKSFERILEMVTEVKAMGLETCLTAGMLETQHAAQLKEAGLDYYNHNLDTSPEYYGQIVTTRTYADRLETLQTVRDSGIHVCCGGILGLGESEEDRIGLLHELANLSPPPESVPINTLVPVEGTPLAETPTLDWTQVLRMVASARILMPKSWLRLSAGRASLSEEAQALCFLAGANSIFLGEKLLTAPNASLGSDQELFQKLGLRTNAKPAAVPLSV